MIAQIDKRIAEEAGFIARKKNEVTMDFPVIRSEIRKEVYEEVKRLLQKDTR